MFKEGAKEVRRKKFLSKRANASPLKIFFGSKLQKLQGGHKCVPTSNVQARFLLSDIEKKNQYQNISFKATSPPARC